MVTAVSTLHPHIEIGTVAYLHNFTSPNYSQVKNLFSPVLGGQCHLNTPPLPAAQTWVAHSHSLTQKQLLP